MPTRISQSVNRLLPVAAAALLLHFGSAVAASPQEDIQQQMKEVLSGSIATRAIPHSESAPATADRSDVDAQAFAGQLLQGWSVSQVGRAMKQKLQAEVSQPSQGDGDFQSTVRQSLVGERVSSRGAW